MGRFFLFVVACLSLAGCAGGPPPEAETAPISSAAGANSFADYRLGIADKVRIIVYNEENLSGEFSVKANGTLSLPMIGSVNAVDRTVEAVQSEVQARLADGFLVNPSVTMEVVGFRPFYILGEVNKPGEYPYSVNLTVLKAVATAQGFTYRAQKKRIFIKRQGEDQERELTLSANTTVNPGDTIRVAERSF